MLGPIFFECLLSYEGFCDALFHRGQCSNQDCGSFYRVIFLTSIWWCWLQVDGEILMFVYTGLIECEHPNNSLYTFTGNLEIAKQTIPVTPNQILLRVSQKLSANIFLVVLHQSVIHVFWSDVLLDMHVCLEYWSTVSVADQGCSLRNTDAIVGAVVFTGHETKVGYAHH